MEPAARQAKVDSLVEQFLRAGSDGPPLASFVSTLDAELRDEVTARCQDAQFIGRFFASLPPLRLLPPLPTEIGGCRLGALLGEGAMGKVFRARQLDLDRDVAIKLLRADAGDHGSFLQRLRDEARVLAALDHPGIVKVLFCGEHDGWLYFGMELVAGRSLADALPDLLRRAAGSDPRRFDRAARIVAEVLEALAYAHRQGIVHRDLKPSNVMLDADGHPKLVDFGLAKGAASPTRTLPGQLVGTPAYMSPELVARRPTERAAPDLWAVGVVLFQLLTGRLPYDGRGSDDVLQALMRPIAQDPRRLTPDVPPDLAAICARALAPDPHARYRTAADFAADLRRFLAGEPVLARRRAPWRSMHRHVRRRAREYTAALVAAGALSVLGIVLDARAEERRIESQLSSLLTTAALTANDARLVASSAARARELLDEPLHTVQRESASQHLAAVRTEAERRHAEGAELVRRGAGSAHGVAVDEYRAPSAALLAAGITRIAEARLIWPDLPGPEAIVASVQPVLVVATAASDGPQPVRVDAVDPITGLADWVAARGTTPCELSVPVGHYRVVVGSDGAFAEATRTIVAPGRYAIDAVLRPTGDVQRGMVLIGAGSATVGQRDKRSPAYAERVVAHRAFFVDRTEVTCGEYHGFMLATGASAPRNWPGPYDPAWERLPVSSVTFQEAARYAEWAGKRLPTWTEWQVTGRGRAAAAYPWGDDPAPLASVTTIGAAPGAWWTIARQVGTDPVDCSWCGAFDMLGNVAEWTESPYVASADGVPVPMFAWRVRGGNGSATRRDYPALSLAAVGAGPPEVMDTGFRCAKSASSD